MSTQTKCQQAGAAELADLEAGEPEARFDQLVQDLLIAFVRVDVHEIDNELNGWLKRILLALNLDQSTVAQIDPKSGSATFTHGWTRESGQITGPPLDADGLSPWLREKILAGQTVVFSSPDELPPEAAQNLQNLGRYIPRSNVTIPVRFAGAVV